MFLNRVSIWAENGKDDNRGWRSMSPFTSYALKINFKRIIPLLLVKLPKETKPFNISLILVLLWRYCGVSRPHIRPFPYRIPCELFFITIGPRAKHLVFTNQKLLLRFPRCVGGFESSCPQTYRRKIHNRFHDFPHYSLEVYGHSEKLISQKETSLVLCVFCFLWGSVVRQMYLWSAVQTSGCVTIFYS